MNTALGMAPQKENVFSKIDTIFKANKVLREGIQQVLIEMMLHVEKCSDIRPIKYFVSKLDGDDSKGLNREAMMEWLQTFCKIDIEYNTQLKNHTVSFNGEADNDIEQGKKKKWWEFKNSNKLLKFDLVAVLNSATELNNKRAQQRELLVKAGKATEAEEIKTNSNLSAAVKALISNPALQAMVIAEQNKLNGVEPKDAE